MHVEQFTQFQKAIENADPEQVIFFLDKYPQNDVFGKKFTEPKWFNFHAPKDRMHRKWRVRNTFKVFDDIRNKYRDQISDWKYKYLRMFHAFCELEKTIQELKIAESLLTKDLWSYAKTRSSRRYFSSDTAENVYCLRKRIEHLRNELDRLVEISNEQPKPTLHIETYWSNYLLTIEMIKQDEKFTKPKKKRRVKDAVQATTKFDCRKFATNELKPLLTGYETVTIADITIRIDMLQKFLILWADYVFTSEVITTGLLLAESENVEVLKMYNNQCTVKWINQKKSKYHLELVL